MIGDDRLPVGGYQSAAAQSREKEGDEAVVVRPHDRFGFAGKNGFQLVRRQRYVEHLDVVDGRSEVGDLLVGQYRIERILRFRNGRRSNRSRLLRRFRYGYFPLPQVSGITFSDDDIYDSREIRKFGYALDNEENEMGVRCIAASILDHEGKARNAFSISAPVGRMTDEKLKMLAEYVLESKRNISGEFGFR